MSSLASRLSSPRGLDAVDSNVRFRRTSRDAGVAPPRAPFGDAGADPGDPYVSLTRASVAAEYGLREAPRRRERF